MLKYQEKNKTQRRRVFFENLEERSMVSSSVLGIILGALFVPENHENKTVQINDDILSGTINGINGTYSLKSILQKPQNTLSTDNLFSADFLFDEDELSTIAQSSGTRHSSNNSVTDVVWGNESNSFWNFLSEETYDLTQQFGDDLLLNQTQQTKQTISTTKTPSHFSSSSFLSIDNTVTSSYAGIMVTSGNVNTVSIITTPFVSEALQPPTSSQTSLTDNFTESYTQTYSEASYGDVYFCYAAIEGGAYTNHNYNPDTIPTVINDTAYVFQGNNGIANVRANIDGDIGMYEGYEWSIEILEPGNYWNITFWSDGVFGCTDSEYDGREFQWQKPENLENSDSSIDRDFTFRFTVDDMYVDLDVHIAWAEVQVQFAGQGGFKHTTTTDTQSTDNTVVVGQKVKAKLEYDPTVTLLSETWAIPTGGSYVKNYITNNNTGTVVNHTSSDYTANTFEFYYTSTSTTGQISINSIFADPNGYSHGINRNASYYLETPTVVSYTSLWASWSSAPNEPPTGIRPFEANDVDELILGGTPTGQPFSAGITWTANVTKPPIVGGGQIAFNQLVNGTYLRYIEGISAAVEKACYTNGNYVLDDTFPYSNIVSVQNTLINDDSPGTGELEETSSNFSQPFNKYTAHFSFQTYLIYQPAGNDSKWVTLGVIYWGWNATAVYSQGSWGVTSGTTTGGGTGTTTSILPTWNDNVQGRHGWTTY